MATREITFGDISRTIETVNRASSGYDMYPAHATRVFTFMTSDTRNMMSAIADATELREQVSDAFPIPPVYEIELLDKYDQFSILKRAVQRAPRYFGDANVEESF